MIEVIKSLCWIAVGVNLTILTQPIEPPQPWHLEQQRFVYSQDPRSCGDPKLPFPSAPPCNSVEEGDG
jgi:hypothetical protein